MNVTEFPRRPRRSMAWLALPALLVLTLTGTGSTGAPARQSLLPEGALAPTLPRHPRAAKRVATNLEQAHYRRTAIDDRMAEEIYTRYVDSLDSQRNFLLASDIEEFDAWKHRFDDMIRTGDMEPAFAMYARRRQRERERIEYALALLETEPDFSLQESFEFDRTKAPWPAGKAELDELWRKRVKSDAIGQILAGKSWEDTADTLRKRYERMLKRADQVTADEVFEIVMNAYARTYDPHSNYFSPRNSEEYRIQMSLSYEGIGATLQTDDEYAAIVNLLPGGPAAAAGTLGIKDRIIGIAQGTDGTFQDVIGWRLDDVVQLIRGKGGTTVRLQLLPAGAAPGSPEKIIDLTRGKVTLENQASKKDRRTVMRNGKPVEVGVISVPGFYRDVEAESRNDPEYRSTTRDVSRLLDELRAEGPLDGLIIDLRGDGGGFLPEATALTGLFIDSGPVVLLKDYTGRIEVLEDPSPGVAYDGPLIVLVDRYSASASEIFAGAIQDYRRGYVVGQRTFGKGTVQSLMPLDRWTRSPDDGQLTVTIGKFYRVTGESTQHRGVEPDIELPSPIDLNEVGESSLEGALPWDRIAPVNFQPFAARPPLPTAVALIRSEADRGKTDPDFQWLVNSLAANQQLREQKSLSLNLEARKAEREKLDSDRLQRENERRKALGKPAFATLTDMEASDEVNGDKAPDILLDRTAEIMGDVVAGIGPGGTVPAGPRTAQSSTP